MRSVTSMTGQSGNEGAKQDQTYNHSMRSSRIPQPSPTKKKNEHEKEMKQKEQQSGAFTPTRFLNQQQQLPQARESSPTPSPTPPQEVDMTTLLRFIERREWMCVVKFFELHQHAPHQRTPTGNLPLHEALKHHPPLPVINLLLEMNGSAARYVGAHGYLPLHVACLCRPIKADVVARLIGAHPAALRTREPHKDGLPLHLAVQTGVGEEVLMELLTNYPEASFVQDGSGRIPLDYANESCHHHNRSIVALETAPILLAAAKAAQARVAREYEHKMVGLREAHDEYVRQLEVRFQDERTGFVESEIQFSDDLAYEKELNIAMAEMLLDIKNAEKSIREDRDALRERLDKDAAEFRLLIDNQEQQLRSVLERTGVNRVSNGEQGEGNVSRDLPAHQESGDGEKENAGISMQSCSGKPLAVLVEDLAKKYEDIQAENVGLKEQLQYKEDMVRHLNQLLASKDEEIPRLNQRIHELERSHESAMERALALESSHEAAIKQLATMRDEVHQLKEANQIQQSQLQESKRKIRIQEHRLGSIKGLVTSLNFNMETWLDEEEWKGQIEDERKKRESDGDESRTYASTIEDVDVSGADISSPSGSVAEGQDLDGKDEKKNPRNEFDYESRNENILSSDTDKPSVIVEHHHGESNMNDSVRGIHKAISYETTTTNTTTPTYLESNSCEKSVEVDRMVRAVTPVPQTVQRLQDDEVDDICSLSSLPHITSLHRTLTDCGLPKSISPI